MGWRLLFMRLKVSTEDAADRRSIEAGLKPAYLRKLVTELDLPGRYESLIRQTFSARRQNLCSNRPGAANA